MVFCVVCDTDATATRALCREQLRSCSRRTVHDRPGTNALMRTSQSVLA